METSHTKRLGAYYTDPQIASYLANWAIRSKQDVILDPACGDGIFLEAALKQLATAKNPGKRLYGVEIDSDAYNRLLEGISNRISKENLINSDFFEVSAAPSVLDANAPRIPPVDAVIGNPPYIRYQRFKGKTKKLAQLRAKQAGVDLNSLSSSWAYFVAHSVSFLASGGRIAMVLPAELIFATYAAPILRFLVNSFRKIEILTFRRKLFPALSEDTVLLLAEGKSSENQSFCMKDLRSVEELQGKSHSATSVEIGRVLDGNARMIEYLIPSEARNLYRKMKSDQNVHPLCKYTKVGIGYVTGNNDFFHLSADEAKDFGINGKFLSKSVRSSTQLEGLFYRKEDWLDSLASGNKVLLLDLKQWKDDLSKEVQDYITLGENRGVHKGYKCRNRNPWWVVPHVYPCDGFLTYMAGKRAQLVVNETDAVATNTLHIVRLKELDPDLMKLLAASWMTSFTSLSAEIEGRSLGGGMLKLEPSEAQRTHLAMPDIDSRDLKNLASRIDELLRNEEYQAAQNSADKVILNDGLGMKSEEIKILQSASERLRKRRNNR